MNDQTTKIKVLVRVRPLLNREISVGALESLVIMPSSDSTKVSLQVPPESSYHSQHNNTIKSDTIEEYKNYQFDECIWSFNSNDPNYVNNLQFYDKSGPDIIEHFFRGYNVCLLTYGQTGSGKTFTMMGDQSQPGLIPLIVRDILRQKEQLISERINCQVKVSYLEIYNEQVNDLLDTNGATKRCRVREHPSSGPYVENLKEVEISDFNAFRSHLERGNKNRSTAATSMNDKSSRSHAILQLTLKQTRYKTDSDIGSDDSSDSIGDAEEEVISNIKLVDLAGSERLNKTKNFGQQDRMKEGSLINKSLTVLGRCINILATNSSNPVAKPALVPFRDSILTYILKENLSGNSKSFMIFNISPVDFEETYQTLNYAKQVTKIKTKAKANTNKLNSKPIDWEKLRGDDQDIIESLRKEINELNSKLAKIGTDPQPQDYQAHPEFENMVLFLERDLDRVKFENKFIKLKLLQKSSQVNELLSYIKYMEGEFKTLSEESMQMRQMLWNSMNSKCDKSIDSLTQVLDHFDPKHVL